jgi:hypothetical protein
MPCDLVVHGASLGMPGITAPGDANPSPEYPATMGLRIAGLLLPGSLNSLFPLVNWSQVEDNAELGCCRRC